MKNLVKLLVVLAVFFTASSAFASGTSYYFEGNQIVITYNDMSEQMLDVNIRFEDGYTQNIHKQIPLGNRTIREPMFNHVTGQIYYASDVVWAQVHSTNCHYGEQESCGSTPPPAVVCQNTTEVVGEWSGWTRVDQQTAQRSRTVQIVDGDQNCGSRVETETLSCPTGTLNMNSLECSTSEQPSTSTSTQEDTIPDSREDCIALQGLGLSGTVFAVGVQADGSEWDGSQIPLETENGGVKIPYHLRNNGLIRVAGQVIDTVTCEPLRVESNDDFKEHDPGICTNSSEERYFTGRDEDGFHTVYHWNEDFQAFVDITPWSGNQYNSEVVSPCQLVFLENGNGIVSLSGLNGGNHIPFVDDSTGEQVSNVGYVSANGRGHFALRFYNGDVVTTDPSGSYMWPTATGATGQIALAHTGDSMVVFYTRADDGMIVEAPANGIGNERQLGVTGQILGLNAEETEIFYRRGSVIFARNVETGETEVLSVGEDVIRIEVDPDGTTETMLGNHTLVFNGMVNAENLELFEEIGDPANKPEWWIG